MALIQARDDEQRLGSVGPRLGRQARVEGLWQAQRASPLVGRGLIEILTDDRSFSATPTDDDLGRASAGAGRGHYLVLIVPERLLCGIAFLRPPSYPHVPLALSCSRDTAFVFLRRRLCLYNAIRLSSSLLREVDRRHESGLVHVVVRSQEVQGVLLTARRKIESRRPKTSVSRGERQLRDSMRLT
jgi:hypothetical protein